jgi:hypothetical protein
MTTATEPRSARYLSCAETAKLVRAALKREVPGIKFGVRSKTYAGGASISVNYPRGAPEGTGTKAKAAADPYQGGGFDGMIDMAYHVKTWLLPDGTVEPAYSGGTGGSMGTVPGYDHPKPSAGAELVRFGADFIFVNRDWK